MIIHVIVYANKEGRKDERADQAERRLAALEVHAKRSSETDTAIALLTKSLGTLEGTLIRIEGAVTKRIDTLEHDLRNLLTGRVKPARRPPEEDA